MESGDCKCAVEEMPTKKNLVRDEKIKQTITALRRCQSDDASSTNIIWINGNLFVFSLLAHAENYFYRPSAIKQRREGLQFVSFDMKQENRPRRSDDGNKESKKKSSNVFGVWFV